MTIGRQAIPRVAMITGLFLGAILGAWGWFHIAPPSPTRTVHFVAANHLEGWRFRHEPLSEMARSILATTNLFNGEFLAERGDPVTVFAAAWSRGSAKVMSVVEHTPDVCWVGSGWIPVDLGQPRRVDLELGGQSIPFECRGFAGPRGGAPVLVLWCTLIDGQVLPESERWSAETDLDNVASIRLAHAARRTALGHFMHNVATRRAAHGEKQFVRLSVPVTSDWREGLERLRHFGSRWLSIL
jgi:hypothetical protein